MGAHGGEGHYRECVKTVGREEVQGQDEPRGGARVGVRGAGPGPDAVITAEEAWFWDRSLRKERERERETVKVTSFVYESVLQSCITILYFFDYYYYY